MTVFIFAQTFEETKEPAAKDLIRTLSKAIEIEESKLEKGFLKIHLSYDKSMKCVRATVPNFELRTTIGAIVDLNSDGFTHYSSEDCINGNTRMIMTFYLGEFEKADWADINLEEIISKSIENVTSEEEYTLEPLLPLKFHADKATAVLKASANLVADIINKIPPFQHSRQGAPVVRFPIGAGKTSRTTFVDYSPPAEPEKKKRRRWGSSLSKTQTLNTSFSNMTTGKE